MYGCVGGASRGATHNSGRCLPKLYFVFIASSLPVRLCHTLGGKNKTQQLWGF